MFKKHQVRESVENVSEEDKVCYENLAKSVNEQKQKDPKRKSKKEIKYMKNDNTWRSTFSKRGKSLILMVSFFVKNQVKLKIKNLKSEQLLYRNAQLNFSNLVSRVLSYLENSSSNCFTTVFQIKKRLNAEKVELYHFQQTKLKIIYIIFSTSDSNYHYIF